MGINELTEAVISAAIEVHRHTGPGLLESAYEQRLCRELSLRPPRSQRSKSNSSPRAGREHNESAYRGLIALCRQCRLIKPPQIRVQLLQPGLGQIHHVPRFVVCERHVLAQLLAQRHRVKLI